MLQIHWDRWIYLFNKWFILICGKYLSQLLWLQNLSSISFVSEEDRRAKQSRHLNWFSVQFEGLFSNDKVCIIWLISLQMWLSEKNCLLEKLKDFPINIFISWKNATQKYINLSSLPRNALRIWMHLPQRSLCANVTNLRLMHHVTMHYKRNGKEISNSFILFVKMMSAFR